jgi:molybdenum cofactor cytidylyltransferase
VNELPVGIIILAAGASTRMGEAKQLLRYEGKSLLRLAVEAALGTQCRPVVVVLGAQAETLCAEISDMEAHAVVNHSWREGMSSSLRCGIATLDELTSGQAEAAVITLCDQPLVTAGVIERLVETYRAGGTLLVASEYEIHDELTRGVPALFSRALFTELLSLRGDAGAKRVIAQHAGESTVVAVPEAAFDVDTLQDYQTLQTM